MIRFSSWLIAKVEGLFRPSEAKESERLYRDIKGRLVASRLLDDEGRAQFAISRALDVAEHFDLDPNHPEIHKAARLTLDILSYECLFLLPLFDPAKKQSTSEHWQLQELLRRQAWLLDHRQDVQSALTKALIGLLAPLFVATPAMLDDGDADSGLTFSSPLVRSLNPLGDVMEAMIKAVGDDAIFPRLSVRLRYNQIVASGYSPDDPKSYERLLKRPSQIDAKIPEALVESFFGETPLESLFAGEVPFVLTTESRFEHTHIIAGSGHGKTQCLQFLIHADLEEVARGKRSVVVLDSQGDLINTLASLKCFAPGEALHERIVIIDPSDVEWPVSLNLFDVGSERLSHYAPLERERLTNSILELYDFVLGSLLSAEMTQKQNVIFRYVTRLMLHIPDATIHTLRQLMEPDGKERFKEAIAKLEGTARQFFETEFNSKEFEQTKRQVLRRLWGILENQTFERMFSHSRSKLDLFTELNSGKIILINTAKDLLKEQGAEIFGRFFIALIAQAAQERATLKPSERLPTFVYIDEAADYFDRNIGLILAQARKQKVGMVLAHQYLGQLEPKLQEAFAANTAIKLCGGVSAKDARTLAPMLGTDPAFIESQPKGSFAASVRGKTKSAVSLPFPLGFVENLKKMSPLERQALRDKMRERYAAPVGMVRKAPEVTDKSDGEEEEEVETSRPQGHTDTDAGETW